ncbi:hypothetical protein Mtc_0763 [Methanocella conradii HZ254]|uniref:Uncharacterized protein n=1 Tax=Methanocella conradii (strain DSM 24694 / JCM 17849 / CGMCC 1.5162 / HZ254) TaxID=1041930 RepID=H8I9A9_METCZ|nr:DUF5788 family protein [Methanocella conradii]AFC99527.1 hypothetical protein Mtc_0763 [Methanocella conradii HZ254]MDI6897371.1 DUF5788 family protein [Methanocella conradii]
MLPELSEENRRAIKGTTPKQAVKDVENAVCEAVKEEKRGERRLITPEERAKLELKLHRLLVWVGVITPFEFELGGRKVPLHDIVWDLLAKDCLTEEEKEYVNKLIDKLQKHEKVNEEILHSHELTEEEADAIFNETAGLLRAIVSLKSLVGRKDTCPVRERVNKRRLEEAKYWLSFLRQIT